MKKTHGMTNTRMYRIWDAMKQRCYNKNHPVYKDYGGRGIQICPEWRTDFMSFYNWATQNGYQEDLTIDRIDNDGDYEPSNCRWATLQEQENNRRTTVFVELDGEKMSLKQWAEKTGVRYQTVLRKRARRKRGMMDREEYLEQQREKREKEIREIETLLAKKPDLSARKIAEETGMSKSKVHLLRREIKERRECHDKQTS